MVCTRSKSRDTENCGDVANNEAEKVFPARVTSGRRSSGKLDLHKSQAKEMRTKNIRRRLSKDVENGQHYIQPRCSATGTLEVANEHISEGGSHKKRQRVTHVDVAVCSPSPVGDEDGLPRVQQASHNVEECFPADIDIFVDDSNGDSAPFNSMRLPTGDSHHDVGVDRGLEDSPRSRSRNLLEPDSSVNVSGASAAGIPGVIATYVGRRRRRGDLGQVVGVKTWTMGRDSSESSPEVMDDGKRAWKGRRHQDIPEGLETDTCDSELQEFWKSQRQFWHNVDKVVLEEVDETAVKE